MATLVGELISALTGELPGYSAFLAKRHIGHAWRDILQRRTWSFLIQDGGFNAPALIQSGYVTVTQNSNLVVADPLLAGPAFQLAVSATPPLTQLQFRISTAGAIYNIVSWNNTTLTLTLDRPILEPSGVQAGYMVYQCYFPPPPQAKQVDGSYDFNRWISLADPINGWVLTDEYTKAWLDTIDPQRATTDLAYRRFDYKTLNGVPLIELWPHPTSGQEYICLYKARGLGFMNGLTPIPQVIPDALLMDRALGHYAYRWAAINAGRDPKLQKTNWLGFKKDADDQWEKDLQKAKLEDDNLWNETIVGPLCQKGWPPVDAQFLQSHSTGLEAWGI